MSDAIAVPEARKESCVGPDSADAGKAAGCAGCPNAKLCASGAGRAAPDPDLPLIAARLAGIRLRLLVLSGKGGVGKSTVTKELALALGRRGLDVGVMDADLCGPSQPRMLGVRAEEIHHNAQGITPVSVREGVSMMSIHFLMGDESKNDAITWRGPQKNGTLKAFLKSVNWQENGPLDCLIIDTPPGTTDEHITLASLLTQVQAMHDAASAEAAAAPSSRTCAIVVTTPQEVSVNDVRRELTFCVKAKIPVLGLVVNMDGFVCPCCNKVSHIFPSDATTTAAASSVTTTTATTTTTGPRRRNAADALAAEFGIPVLGRLPLDPRVMLACEAGVALAERGDDEDAALIAEGGGGGAGHREGDDGSSPVSGPAGPSPAVAAFEDMTDRIMDLCGLCDA